MLSIATTITNTNAITITGGPGRRTEEGPESYFPLMWFSHFLFWGGKGGPQLEQVLGL